MNAPIRSGVILAACSALAITTLGLVFLLSKERVIESQQRRLRQELLAVLPAGPYDDDPLNQRRQIQATQLGGEPTIPVYTVHRDGEPLAAVLGIETIDGYNGTIALLIGLHADGHIIGVRTTEHRETPGLGDRIEIRRSDWIRRFEGQRLDNHQTSPWPLIRTQDGYDVMTGATITAQAVTQAVRRALLWFKANQRALFSR